MKGLIYKLLFTVVGLNMTSFIAQSQDVNQTDSTIFFHYYEDCDVEVKFGVELFMFDNQIQKKLHLQECQRTYFFNILITENSGYRLDLLYIKCGNEEKICIIDTSILFELIVMLNSVQVEINDCPVNRFNIVIPISFN